ncbi:MAG: efflux transporter periplasmic adaptor subunit, partial [Bacteroidaceae bacterium]|nr:efflux transporter periplasmic adaptor subunit [Bacteroidaceae bacterium]
MNRYLKWGFVVAIAAGASVYGYFQLTPRQNEELAKVDNTPAKSNKKVLNVTAKILKPHLLTDEILTVGKLVPDEEVQLT